MSDLSSLLQNVEALIRLGDLKKAAQLLAPLSAKQIAPVHRAQMANLCRRVGLYNLGIRILRPALFHPKTNDRLHATADERAEYAILLLRVGALRESLQTLKSLEGPDNFATAELYRAFAKISRWDYASAAVHLRAYLNFDLDPYQRRLGQLNLAASAFHSGDLESAKSATESILSSIDKNSGRVHANILEIMARIAIEEEQFAKAKDHIQQAQEFMSGASSYDQLFIHGVKAYLTALESGRKDELTQFREEAQLRRRFESVREADIYLLKLDPNPDDFARLYFGTPYPHLRNALQTMSGMTPAAMTYRLGSGDRSLDLSGNGISEIESAGSRRLLRLLASDFYRPLGYGQIFEDVYPDENFEAQSTIHRVKQLIYRTRKTFTDAGLDLEIRNHKTLYQLQPGESLSLLVGVYDGGQTAASEFVQTLRQHLAADAEFALRDVQPHFDCGRSTLLRQLDGAIAEGLIEKFGAGPKTAYSFASAVAPLAQNETL